MAGNELWLRAVKSGKVNNCEVDKHAMFSSVHVRSTDMEMPQVEKSRDIVALLQSL